MITANPNKRVIKLTDNSVELIKAIWDGERFALTRYDKQSYTEQAIILNKAEMNKLLEFLVIIP